MAGVILAVICSRPENVNAHNVIEGCRATIRLHASAGGGMALLALGDYLPLADLAKIVAVTLAIAVAAPSAASIAIAGLERRRSGAVRRGTAPVIMGAGVLLLLVGIGLSALVHR